MINHPLLVLGVLIFFCLGELIIGLLGGWSALLYWQHERPTDPAYAVQVAATELTFDVGVSVLLPLVTSLSTAALMAYGLVRHGQHRERQVNDAIASAGRTLEQATQALTSTVTAELNSASSKGIKELHHHLEALMPGWYVAISDAPIREQLRVLLLSIRDSLDQTNAEHRVIVRSICRGMIRRFSEISATLSHKGSFMDPNERRELTEELFKSTGSYHVIFFGMRPLKTGDWRWHQDYIQFLRRAKALHGDQVTWTFADWEDIPEREKRLAVRQVHELGLKCFVFPREGMTGDLGIDPFRRFFSQGPLIEVFGRDFPSEPGETIKDNAFLTWKATELCVRSSRNEYAAWEPGTPGSPPKGEGVWAADNIDKLIRAGVISGRQSPEFRVLDKICQHRQLQGG